MTGAQNVTSEYLIEENSSLLRGAEIKVFHYTGLMIKELKLCIQAGICHTCIDQEREREF